MPDLSIVIVTYNSEKDIRACLESIQDAKGTLTLEVFVIDNNSTDDTVRIVREKFPWVTVIANSNNVGFPAANNQGITLSRGEHIMLLNPDTIVHRGALETLVTFVDRNRSCGICGPCLQDAQGRVAVDLRAPRLWPYLMGFFGLGTLLPKHPPQSQDALCGACLVFRRSLVSEIGLLDERLFWCEDVDYCTRARKKGYSICRVDNVRVTHLVGQSAKSNLGLALEKYYTSKIGYLHKHASPLETTLMVLVFVIEAAARYAKWRVISLVRPSSEATIRVGVFARMIREIPRYAVGQCKSRTRGYVG